MVTVGLRQGQHDHFAVQFGELWYGTNIKAMVFKKIIYLKRIKAKTKSIIKPAKAEAILAHELAGEQEVLVEEAQEDADVSDNAPLVAKIPSANDDDAQKPSHPTPSDTRQT